MRIFGGLANGDAEQIRQAETSDAPEPQMRSISASSQDRVITSIQNAAADMVLLGEDIWSTCPEQVITVHMRLDYFVGLDVGPSGRYPAGYGASPWKNYAGDYWFREFRLDQLEQALAFAGQSQNSALDIERIRAGLHIDIARPYLLTFDPKKAEASRYLAAYIKEFHQKLFELERPQVDAWLTMRDRYRELEAAECVAEDYLEALRSGYEVLGPGPRMKPYNVAEVERIIGEVDLGAELDVLASF